MERRRDCVIFRFVIPPRVGIDGVPAGYVQCDTEDRTGAGADVRSAGWEPQSSLHAYMKARARVVVVAIA